MQVVQADSRGGAGDARRIRQLLAGQREVGATAGYCSASNAQLTRSSPIYCARHAASFEDEPGMSLPVQPRSSWNCSNSPRISIAGTSLASDMIGVTV
jgi:hypothetical protein